MTKSLTLSLTLLALGLVVLMGVLLLKPFENAVGAGYIGWSVYQTSATTTTVGPQAVKATTIFAERTDGSCKSRIIGTKATPIVILFADPVNGDLSSTTLNGATGFVQGASTTVAYESGIYGCGKWTGYASASTTITVSEF